MDTRKRLLAAKPSGDVLRRRNRTVATPKLIQKLLPFSRGDSVTTLLAGPTMDRHREDDHLHVSDLIGKCIRRFALLDKYKIPVPSQPIFDSQGITFAQGDAIHDYIKNKIRAKHPDKIYGRWACWCGATEKTGTYAQCGEQECPVCTGKLTRYKELSIYNNEVGVVGNVDLPLLIERALLLTEIKSISKKGFDELSAAKADHVIQILLYWWLAREHGYDLHDKVSVIYAVKEFTFKGSPYKEFTMQPSNIIARVEPFVEDARHFQTYKQTGKLPPRVECPTRMAPKAKKCDMCDTCFGSKA